MNHNQNMGFDFEREISVSNCRKDFDKMSTELGDATLIN